MLIREDDGIERIESREAVGEMNDGNQACKILTQTAREHDVPVAIANEPICNRAAQEGDNLWAPGTLNFVGGSQGRAPFRDCIMEVAKENPGPQKVAVVTRPDTGRARVLVDEQASTGRSGGS